MLSAKRLILLTLVVWLAACKPTPSANPPQAQSEIQRETSPSVAEADLSELVAGNSAFAFDLYQALREEGGNLFYSPHSISIALAMTYAGAQSNTEQQMAETLHYTLPQEHLHPAFNALDLSLTDRDQEQEEETFTLNVANSIWGQEGSSFRQEFLDTIAENYGAGLRLVDFVDEGAREEARLTINEWVSEQTEDKIKDLIPEGILTEWTRLVLANGIYFKAEWEYPFNPAIDGTFHLLNGDQVDAPMMSRRTTFGYAEGEGYQAVQLPYKGGRAEMVALLPAEGEFETFENSLDGARIHAILETLAPHDIRLTMPKFEYESSFSLAETLAKMGMPDAFDPNLADLSGMDGTDLLFIKHVLHKAFIAVNEVGTEAAAATAVIAEIESMPFKVVCDRPFIFIIRDTESGAILFVGRVMDPSP